MSSNKDWCLLVSAAFVNDSIKRDRMERFIIDMICSYLLLKIRRWDPERMDPRMAVIEETDESSVITKNARIGSWDWNSAFVEGAASNSIDITFLLVKYQSISSVTLGICPIESYEQRKGKRDSGDGNNHIGNTKFKGSISYNAYTGGVMVDGKSRNGVCKAKTGDTIRILLEEGNLDFFVNDTEQCETIKVDQQQTYIVGVSMYVKDDKIAIVPSKRN